MFQLPNILLKFLIFVYPEVALRLNLFAATNYSELPLEPWL